MRDPKVLDTAELEPALADLRRARDAAADEGAGGEDIAELDRLIAQFEEEVRIRHRH